MPGLRIKSNGNDEKEVMSQEISGPLSEILHRLKTCKEQEARSQAEMTSEILSHDLTPSATFEPSMRRPSSPVNFHADDAMNVDDDDEYTRSHFGGHFNSELSRYRSDSLDARRQAPSKRNIQSEKSNFVPNLDSEAEKKFAVAQIHLEQGRKEINDNPNHDKLKVESPPSVKGRSPTWLYEARPTLAPREDPKSQLMGLLYDDPGWTAQRFLKKIDEKRAGKKPKAAEGSFWDEL